MRLLRSRACLRAERLGGVSPTLAWNVAGERRRVEKGRLTLERGFTNVKGWRDRSR